MKLLLKSRQSPGDIVMMTAAVRDLHLAHPGKYATAVDTSAKELWDGNKNIEIFDEKDSCVKVVQMHYPLIHDSNRQPYHFIKGYLQYLEETLGIKIPLTAFHGDLCLSPEEKENRSVKGQELPQHYWVVMAGGKYDFTAKWWNPAFYQEAGPARTLGG